MKNMNHDQTDGNLMKVYDGFGETSQHGLTTIIYKVLAIMFTNLYFDKASVFFDQVQ